MHNDKRLPFFFSSSLLSSLAFDLIAGSFVPDGGGALLAEASSLHP